MAEFNVRSEAIDVEEIMHRIRARIREKRGVDYTEDEIRHIATATLEKFLDPGTVRSDLVEHYRQLQVVPDHEQNYAFEDSSIYASSPSLVGRLIVRIRRILNPVLKLFFNPNVVIHVLHMQSKINDRIAGQVALKYEVLNNLVVELTRLKIESKNLTMRVESLSSRLDFDERRAHALEGIVQYRATATPRASSAGGQGHTVQADGTGDDEPRPRRRRRRSRRRSPGSENRPPTEAVAKPSNEPSADAADASSPPTPAPDAGQSEP
ncbi:MAG TPA: hypothetical protein QGH10_18105 [Armatimonadota bacterium]|nr:hypothetical protein [Armatimonadota bacterium]